MVEEFSKSLSRLLGSPKQMSSSTEFLEESCISAYSGNIRCSTLIWRSGSVSRSDPPPSAISIQERTSSVSKSDGICSGHDRARSTRRLASNLPPKLHALKYVVARSNLTRRTIDHGRALTSTLRICPRALLCATCSNHSRTDPSQWDLSLASQGTQFASCSSICIWSSRRSSELTSDCLQTHSCGNMDSGMEIMKGYHS
jgi:hypothetical protein